MAPLLKKQGHRLTNRMEVARPQNLICWHGSFSCFDQFVKSINIINIDLNYVKLCWTWLNYVKLTFSDAFQIFKPHIPLDTMRTSTTMRPLVRWEPSSGSGVHSHGDRVRVACITWKRLGNGTLKMLWEEKWNAKWWKRWDLLIYFIHGMDVNWSKSGWCGFVS